MQTRRDFIKDTCTACLSTTFLGLSVFSLSSCSSLPIYKTSLSQGLAEVPISSFGDSTVLILRDIQMPFDVLLVKKSIEEYLALYMQCTHQENPVTATENGLYCSAHGSSFDLEGNPTKEPASKPLKRFTTEYKINSITIDLNS